MQWLELKIPPLLVLVIFAIGMWLIKQTLPAFDYAFAYGGAALIICAVLGGAIAVAGVLQFRRQQTTVDPTQPQNCSGLVTSGIYAFTRNPMYLGFLWALLGWAAFLCNGLVWVMLPAFVLYLNRFQIGVEEKVLLQLFPEDFPQYQQSVGRWL